jgi:competence protein ComEC
MAMWGIFMFYPKIHALFSFRWGYLQTLWEGTALGLAATLSTAPLSLYYFHSFPNYFALANLFLMSLSSFILMLGMFFPLLAALPFLNQIAGWVLQKSIELMLFVMDFFAHLPGALVNGFQVTFSWVLLFWLGLFIFFQSNRALLKRSALLLITCFVIELSLGRMEQYAIENSLFNQKDQLFIFKKKGKAILCAQKDFKSTKYIATQLTTYYGVNTDVIELN